MRFGPWIMAACLLGPACAADVGGAPAEEVATEQPEVPVTQQAAVEAEPPPRQAVVAEAELPVEAPSQPAPTPEESAPAPSEPEPAAPQAPSDAAPDALCLPARWPALDDLNPVRPAQHVALFVRGQSSDELGVLQLSSWGTACEGSADRVECEIEAAQVADDLPFVATVCDPVCKQFYLSTEIDGVRQAWGNLAAVRELLGSVDTRGEAVLLAFYSFSGVDVSCAAQNPSSVRRVAGGGYDVPVRVRNEPMCGAPLWHATARVDASGRVTLGPTGDVEADPKSCP